MLPSGSLPLAAESSAILKGRLPNSPPLRGEGSALRLALFVPLLSLLARARIPAELIPTKQLICKAATSFGLYRTPATEWKPKTMKKDLFRRVSAIANRVFDLLDTLENT